MEEYDNLDTCNVDSLHDGWLDFDYNENTSELSNIFDDSNLAQFIDYLNDYD